jgi:hypothetical protein
MIMEPRFVILLGRGKLPEFRSSKPRALLDIGLYFDTASLPSHLVCNVTHSSQIEEQLAPHIDPHDRFQTERWPQACEARFGLGCRWPGRQQGVGSASEHRHLA